ncbi:MAG: exo 1,3/1,4-beta-D-glucan glucohydrolase, partial [Pseudomonadales bacterium]
AEIAHITPEQVAQYHVGSVLNGGGSFPNRDKYASIADWRELAESFYSASTAARADGRPAIPLLWGTDAVHGHNNVMGATYFPHNIGLGATRNLDLIKRIAEATAVEVAATNIKWVFAPTVAVAEDPRWGRTYESYAQDPSLVRDYARVFVAGLQGNSTAELAGPNRVVATAKHFVGDGGTDKGIDQGDVLVDEKELFERHAQGFLGALEAGAQTVMASFNSWRGNKVHGSRYLLTDVLKETLGFDGFVVGDWNGHGQLPGCSNQSCPAAINAGVDMIMVPEDWREFIANTLAQVRDGTIPEQRIDDAVKRILRVKMRAGLFSVDHQNGALVLNELLVKGRNATSSNVVGNAAHRELAREAVRESLVLLKNNDALLPLHPRSHVLVTGAAADNISQQSCGWTLTWQGDNNQNSDFPGASSILDGIRETVEAAGGRVTYVANPNELATGAQLTPDVAIVVMGEQPYAEGVGDRSDVSFSHHRTEELETLEKLQAQGIPTAAVFISGRPLWVNNELNTATAFVAAWLPGSEGAGIADVLFADQRGKPRFDFTGTLPFAWPAHPRQANAAALGEQPLFALHYGLDYNASQQLAKLPVYPYPAVQLAGYDESLPVFLKKVIEPWTMFVGDSDNWGVELNGSAGRTVKRPTVVVEPIDHALQGDARRIRWSTSEIGQVYFQHNTPLDLKHLLKNEAALVFNLRVDRPPTDSVKLRIDCQYPCTGEVDITGSLKAQPRGEWQRFAIDIECFAEAGTNFKQVDTPFLMVTGGQLEVGISDISFEAGARDSANISCDRPVSNL